MVICGSPRPHEPQQGAACDPCDRADAHLKQELAAGPEPDARPVLLLVLVFAYILGTSLHNAFNDLLAISAWLTVGFYMLTAMAMTAYYRRQVFVKVRTAVTVGLLPLDTTTSERDCACCCRFAMGQAVRGGLVILINDRAGDGLSARAA